MTIDLAHLTFWQSVWLTLVAFGSIVFGSFIFRWFIGTQKLHEDLQQILAELKKLTKEKKNEDR